MTERDIRTCTLQPRMAGVGPKLAAMTYKRGDWVQAARDIELGLDVVIRARCPGRVSQRIGALTPHFTVVFTSRDDPSQNEIIARGLAEADLQSFD
jgi:hypothetical protein